MNEIYTQPFLKQPTMQYRPQLRKAPRLWQTLGGTDRHWRRGNGPPEDFVFQCRFGWNLSRPFLQPSILKINRDFGGASADLFWNWKAAWLQESSTCVICYLKVFNLCWRSLSDVVMLWRLHGPQIHPALRKPWAQHFLKISRISPTSPLET